MDNINISSQPLEQLITKLKSSKEGITNTLAQKRIKKQIKTFKTESRLKREFKLLTRQFTNPLVLLLAIAVILSAALRESSDAIIILFILIATGLLGFWQERNAGRAIEQLRGMIEMKHTILREGKEHLVSTGEVVAGDILLLDAGDIIPADCRLIESNELHVNESVLTGESFPVEKITGEVDEREPLHRKTNCLWQGTNIISGTAKAIAVQTGIATYYGKMAHSLTQTSETAFEKGIKKFGFFLLRITIILSLIILIANLYFKKPFFDSVLFSLALAVGMAPELLPAIMTFAMSAGAKRMLKKKVIIKQLSSIFNFGEVNILCTDKTGTITEGNVAVKDIITINGKPDPRLRQFAFLNARFQNGFTNPIDQAIISLQLSINGYKKINEIPYDFIRKRLSVAVKKDTNKFFITKGALANVLEICSYIENDDQISPISEKHKIIIEKNFTTYSQDGYRVLGLSYKRLRSERITRADEQDMIFLGFILLEDPLKESAIDSLERLKQLHVKTKIVTGDNYFAAVHAAQRIGISKPVVLKGKELNELSPEALLIKALHTDVFAEVEPQQKERIIKALQKSHLSVAYIGDGINDVAAINAADIGISTNNAVDVAKDAADFVLLDKDLSVLADGILEGRKSFVNSMKYIFITTGATFGNMFSVAGASLFLPFLPMLPKQILLTNLITDLPFLTIASDNVDNQQLKVSQKWDIKLIRNFMIVFGLHSSFFDFATFYLLYHYFHLSGSTFQTGWFLESTITELLILFVIRSPFSSMKNKPGKLLLITSFISLLLIMWLPFSPFAATFGFSVAHTSELIAIITILVFYYTSANFLKTILFRRSSQ